MYTLLGERDPANCIAKRANKYIKPSSKYHKHSRSDTHRRSHSKQSGLHVRLLQMGVIHRQAVHRNRSLPGLFDGPIRTAPLATK